MKKFIFIISLLLFSTPNIGQAQETNTRKSDDIKKLIMLVNSNIFEGLNEFLAYSIVSSFKNSYPNTKEENLEAAKNAALAKLAEKQDELLDLIVPIYSAVFTHEDVNYILEFLSSDTGKKFINSNPAIITTIQKIALDWGSDVSQEVAETAITYIPEAYLEPEEIEEFPETSLEQDQEASKEQK